METFSFYIEVLLVYVVAFGLSKKKVVNKLNVAFQVVCDVNVQDR